MECWTRHLRVFGLVNNLIHKKLKTSDICQQKDGTILGILALTWNLLIKTLPEEVIAPVKAAIEAAGLPPMAFKDDVKGKPIFKICHTHSSPCTLF